MLTLVNHFVNVDYSQNYDHGHFFLRKERKLQSYFSKPADPPKYILSIYLQNAQITFKLYKIKLQLKMSHFAKAKI